MRPLKPFPLSLLSTSVLVFFSRRIRLLQSQISALLFSLQLFGKFFVLKIEQGKWNLSFFIFCFVWKWHFVTTEWQRITRTGAPGWLSGLMRQYYDQEECEDAASVRVRASPIFSLIRLWYKAILDRRYSYGQVWSRNKMVQCMCSRTKNGCRRAPSTEYGWEKGWFGSTMRKVD